MTLARLWRSRNRERDSLPGEFGVSRLVTYLGGMAAVSLLPFILDGTGVAGEQFAFNVGSEMAIFALALMGMTVLYGWTGQISLAHAGFFGLGAYLTAFVKQWTGGLTYGPIVEVSVVAGAAVVAGVIVGLPATRISGLQLAIVTLGFAEVFQWALNQFDSVFGGTQGLFVGPFEIGSLSTFDAPFRFWLALTFAGVGGLILIRISRSALGRKMLSVRDSELAAQSVGIRPMTVKLWAFVIAAIYAGIAGWLFAHHIFAVTPGYFTLFDNVYFLVGSIIGGRATLLGAWLGGGYLVVVPELVRGVGDGNHFTTVSGIILVIVVVAAPGGLAALPLRLAGWVRLRVRGDDTEGPRANRGTDADGEERLVLRDSGDSVPSAVSRVEGRPNRD